jgi:hypothetical protein
MNFQRMVIRVTNGNFYQINQEFIKFLFDFECDKKLARLKLCFNRVKIKWLN